MSTDNQNSAKDFDAMMAVEFADDESMQTISALTDQVVKLQARVTHYETNAKAARHAFRSARKATTPQEQGEALSAMRDSLRAIHPETEVF